MNKKSKSKLSGAKNHLHFNIQIFNGEGVGGEKKHTITDNKIQERTQLVPFISSTDLSHTSLHSRSRMHLQNQDCHLWASHTHRPG